MPLKVSHFFLGLREEGKQQAHSVVGQWQNCSQCSPAQKASLARWYLTPKEQPHWIRGQAVSVPVTLAALLAWCQTAVRQGSLRAGAQTFEEPQSS